MTPLTVEEFERALYTGHGRAALHLKAHGAAGREALLVEACLHTRCYDREVEGSRAEWMALLIELTGHEGLYRTRILEALAHATDYRSVRQGLELALVWARRGHQDAKRVLYDVWGRVCVERFGTDVAAVFPRFETVADDDLARRMDEVLEEEQPVARSVPPQPERTLDNAERMIEDRTKDPWGGWLSSFGTRMTSQEADVSFARLLAETNAERLVQRLSVFRVRGFPSLTPRIWQLAESADPVIQSAALQALARTNHADVGRFARRLLSKEPSAATKGAIALLAQQYEPADHVLLESLLSVPRNEQDIHSVGSDLVDVGQDTAGPELAPCLLWVYEQTPCSLCRAKSVERLVERKAAPRHVLEECLWDSVADTRQLARAIVG